MVLPPREAPEARIDAVNDRIKIPVCPTTEVAEFQQLKAKDTWL